MGRVPAGSDIPADIRHRHLCVRLRRRGTERYLCKRGRQEHPDDPANDLEAALAALPAPPDWEANFKAADSGQASG